MKLLCYIGGGEEIILAAIIAWLLMTLYNMLQRAKSTKLVISGHRGASEDYFFDFDMVYMMMISYHV